MPFIENYVTWPLINKNIKFSMLLVKSNIFWDDIKCTKHARHKSLFKYLIHVLVRQIICFYIKICDILNICYSMFEINKHRFNNHTFSIILFEFRYKF
jgi:hypothetical protein